VSWDELDKWWVQELESDPSYDEEITPLLLELLDPQHDELYLDLGCGTGRVLAQVIDRGARAVGCDLNQRLLQEARKVAPVVRGVLPSLEWVRPGTFDGAYVGLVVEHLSDEVEFFSSAARAVRVAGCLALVMNHPIWTAPLSSPIDDAHGEVLWRPGRYFGRGHSDEPAGRRKVRFYHRTAADLLNAASAAGWALVQMEERGISRQQVERYPDYAGQEHIPRLLGARWTRQR
jgi:SAM-dependent methyltransferase